MSIISMPPTPAGSAAQVAAQQYAYLFQLVQQLNAALGAIESGAAAGGGSTTQTAPSGAAMVNLKTQVENLRSLVIKTAEKVDTATESLSTELRGQYVAQSDFGT